LLFCRFVVLSFCCFVVFSFLSPFINIAIQHTATACSIQPSAVLHVPLHTHQGPPPDASLTALPLFALLLGSFVVLFLALALAASQLLAPNSF
jgi:hypothetical protein